MLQFVSVLQWAVSSENLADSSNGGSRGQQRRRPSWDTTEPSQRCTPVPLLFRKQISLFSLKQLISSFFFFFYKQGGSQGLIICRHTICRKQSPICCWLFTAPHEDAAGHKPVQFSFSRQRRVAWYSFPNPMERAKQNISFPQNTLNSWILLPDKSCLSNICCSNFSRES